MPTPYMMQTVTPEIRDFRADCTEIVKSMARIGDKSIVQVSAAVYDYSPGGDRWLYQRRFRGNRRIQLASLSKQFTAAAILDQTFRAAGFDIDEAVDDWISNWPGYARDVTVRHLLNHSSGLRQYNYAKLRYRARSVISQIRTKLRDLKHTPGSQYDYCNTGYVALARIVEEIAGDDFPDHMESTFFRPLAMFRTQLRGYGRRKPSGLMRLHVGTNVDPTLSFLMQNANLLAGQWDDTGGYGGQRLVFPMLHTTAEWVPGDGGIVSDVADLWSWGKFLNGNSSLGNRISSRMRRELPLDDGTDVDYGYGLWVFLNNTRLEHGGAFGGAQNYTIYLDRPQEAPNVYVVVLSNYHSTPSAGIANALLDAYLARF